MHPAKILGALALIASFSAHAAEKVPVITQFEQQITALEANLAKEKNIAKRYDLFLATHDSLVKLRKSNPRQPEPDELSMSFFLDTLNDFPAKKNFQAKNCSVYVKKSKTMMANRNTEEGEDPMVARAFKLAEAICK